MTTRDCPHRKSKAAASSLIKRVTGAEIKEDTRASIKVTPGVKQVSETSKHGSLQSIDRKLDSSSINKLACHPTASGSRGSPNRAIQFADHESKVQICHIATRSRGSPHTKLLKECLTTVDHIRRSKSNDTGIVHIPSDTEQVKKVDVAHSLKVVTVQIEKVDVDSKRGDVIQIDKVDVVDDKKFVAVQIEKVDVVPNKKIDVVQIEKVDIVDKKFVVVQIEKVDVVPNKKINVVQIEKLDVVHNDKVAAIQIEEAQVPSITLEIDSIQIESNHVLVPALTKKDNEAPVSTPLIKDCTSNVTKKRLNTICGSKLSCVAPKVSSDPDYHPLVSLDPIRSPRTAMEDGQRFSDSFPTSPVSPSCRIAPLSNWIRGMIKKDEYDLSQSACKYRLSNFNEKIELYNNFTRVSPQLDESMIIESLAPIDIPVNPTIQDLPDCSSISDPPDDMSAFMMLFGLLPKAEVKRMEAAAEKKRQYRNHRLEGGKLRPKITHVRKPGMVYDNEKRGGKNALRGVSLKVAAVNDKTIIGRKVKKKVTLSNLQIDRTNLESSNRTPECVEESKNSQALRAEIEKQKRQKLTTYSSAPGLILQEGKLVDLIFLHRKEESKQSSVQTSSSTMLRTTQSDVAVKRKRHVIDTTSEPRRSSRHEGEERRAWTHLLRAKPDKHHVRALADDTKSHVLLQTQRLPKVKVSPAEDRQQLKRSGTFQPVTSEHVVVPKRSKSFSDSLPTVVEKRARIPNILSRAAPKITSKLIETSSPVKCENDWMDVDDPAGNDTSAARYGFGEQDDKALNQDVYVPVDLSILHYRYNEICCIIPHMCSVCWVNDHMYCVNMKRVPRELPPFGGCIHFLSCHHFRPVHREISQLGVLEPNTFEMGGRHPFRWLFVERNKNINNINHRSLREVRREFKGGEDDLYCDEVMLASDFDSPRHGRENSISGGGGRTFEASGGGEVEILHRQLRIRRNQIIRCLGRMPGNTPPKNTPEGVRDALRDDTMTCRDKGSKDDTGMETMEKPVEVEEYGATVDVDTTELPVTVTGSIKREAESKEVANHYKVRNLLTTTKSVGPSNLVRSVTGEIKPLVSQEYDPQYHPSRTSLIPKPVLKWKKS